MTGRRGVAALIALTAVVVMTCALFLVPVPYGIFSPGPVCAPLQKPTAQCPAIGADALITVSPASADHPTTSRIGATTVNVRNGEPSIAEAIAAWFSADQAVVPREVVIPPGQDQKQVLQQGAVDMKNAQSSAVYVAEASLHLLTVTITSVRPGFPAASVLAAGDVVKKVNGAPIDSATALQLLSAANTDPTAVFTFTIERGGVTRDVAVTRTKDATQGASAPLIFGIALHDDPGDLAVNVRLDPNAVGGPSAGLMLALSVYDRLTPGNLAGDVTVAGTGTIDDAGNVGPIGGIQQKMYAARHSFKASVFLAPAGDCSETKGAIPKGMRVVKVSTFTDALNAMTAIRAGNVASLPGC